MRVGLFVTCLVDMMRPRVGFAALTLLERAGVSAWRLQLEGGKDPDQLLNGAQLPIIIGASRAATMSLTLAEVRSNQPGTSLRGS